MTQLGYLNLPPGTIQAAGAKHSLSGIVPFKTDPDLINTTPEGGSSTYKLKQAAPPILASHYPKGIEWKSPERAYHGQKLLHLLARYTPPNGDLMNDPQVQAKRAAVINMINELNVISAKDPKAGFDPRNDFEPLMQKHLSRLGFRDAKAFNQACGLDFNNPKKDQRDNFMREVLELRYKQHPGFQDKVKRCCEQGKLLVEVSQHDNNWASGLDGQGANRLGVLMMQVGNQYCNPPKIKDPRAAYDDLKKAQPTAAIRVYDPKAKTMQNINCGSYLYHQTLADQIKNNTLLPLPNSIAPITAAASAPAKPHTHAIQSMQSLLQHKASTAINAVDHSKAAQEIAKSINPSNPPAIAAGMQKGTLKALFNSEQEARNFLRANQGKYKMTFHGTGERYPIPGKFIVRFEREEKGDTKPYPESALNFVAVQYKDKSKAEQQLNTVMKPWQSMKLGIIDFNEQIGAKSMLSEEQKNLFNEAKKEILANRDPDTRANTLKCFTDFAKSLNSGNLKLPTIKDLEKCGLKGRESERLLIAITNISEAPEKQKRFKMP